MRLERKFSKLLRIAISCSFLFAFFVYKPAQAQCGSTGGSGTPSCPGTIYRPGAYDDAGTDDPYFYDGYIASNSPSGPVTGEIIDAPTAGNFTVQVNAADYYTWVPDAYWNDYQLEGDCVWSSFPNYVTSSALTLHIPYTIAPDTYGDSGLYIVKLTIGSTTTTLYSESATTTNGEITATIPVGTNLSTVSVEVQAYPNYNAQPEVPGYNTERIESIWLDIYIQ